MSLIIADARLGVWKATDEGGPLTGVDCALEGPRLTCAGSACVCVGGNRECLCLTCHGLREISRMPAAPGLAALCLSPCGRYVYQLSSEADSVHTRLTATGDLIFAAPVGDGIAQTEAQKSSDLFMKCRYLDEITGGDRKSTRLNSSH